MNEHESDQVRRVSKSETLRYLLQYSNAPAAPGFGVGSNNPIEVGVNWAASMNISGVSFNGSFHVSGSLHVFGIPLGSGVIENKLNQNLGLVLAATDLSNFLASNPVPCGSIF
jgi:hypothetical protein